MSVPSNPPVTMVTSSYPRFPGDGIGSFLEPIAHGVAAAGRDVDVVAPWHPALRRPPREGRVRFHFFRYAPTPGLHVFGYASALKADVSLRPTAYLVAPAAVAMAGRAVRRVVRASGAALVHAHWAVPSGFVAAASCPGLPLVISLHGSDVFVAESNPLARVATRWAFHRADAVTACSDDLRRRAVALGARAETATVVPYGVDTDRFKPNPESRTRVRSGLGLGDADPLLLTVGRLVRKKGFEYLIDAVSSVAPHRPTLTLAILGDGDLRAELERRAGARGVTAHIRFVGSVPQDEVAAWLAAADVAVVPSVRDEAGNVDGLPNALLEALASATPVVTTAAGGIESVVCDGVTAHVVAERDARGLAAAIDRILDHPAAAIRLGEHARATMGRSYGWSTTARRFESAYALAIDRRAARRST